MTVKQILHPRNEPIREVFFPNGGVASITTVMRDGAMVEIATIGDEGLIGINAFFGPALMSGEAMMQVPDTNAEAMSVKAFRTELDHRGPFYDCVQVYSQALIMLMMQSTACMALHSVEQRCCRWLLMTHDRVHRDDFQLSHEFLAMMLGSTRPTVTSVAGALQKARLIKYVHGHITIVDRPGPGSGVLRVLPHGQGALRPPRSLIRSVGSVAQCLLDGLEELFGIEGLRHESDRLQPGGMIARVVRAR